MIDILFDDWEASQYLRYNAGRDSPYVVQVERTKIFLWQYSKKVYVVSRFAQGGGCSHGPAGYHGVVGHHYPAENHNKE